jgi:hypothetical protein
MDVLNSYDLVAVRTIHSTEILRNALCRPHSGTFQQVQVSSQRLFEAACERAPVDIISVDCSQRHSFRFSRKAVRYPGVVGRTDWSFINWGATSGHSAPDSPPLT